jgi:hypothetical protein
MKNILCLLGLHKYTSSYQKPLFVSKCQKCECLKIRVLSKELCNKVDYSFSEFGVDDYQEWLKTTSEFQKWARQKGIVK